MDTQNGSRWNLLGRFISLFGLDEYGQENLPRSVRLTLVQFAIVLFAAAMIDLVVWTYQWYLVTENMFMAGALGAVVTVLITSISRMIVVQSPMRQRRKKRDLDGTDDVSESWFSRVQILRQPALFAVFLGLTYALTHYTAVTFSVMIVNSEIEKQITLTESRAYETLVDNAIEKTEREYGRQIADLEKEGLRAAQEASARTSADTEAYKKQRAVERASRVESHEAAILIQKEVAQRSEQERNSELDEGAGVRVSGAGKFYRTKEANYAKQQEQLNKLQEAKIQELRVFDAETLQHVAKKESAREAIIADSAKAVQQLRSELRAKVKDLRNGPTGSVPGEWRVSRGFAAQKLALAQIELADKTGAMTEKRQESHWLMMLFGLMALILKIGLGSKVSAYFDPYAQAARGNEEAKEALRAEGIDDFVAFLRPEDVKVARSELGKRRQAFDGAYMKFQALAQATALPLGVGGRYRRLEVIQNMVKDAWFETAAEAFDALCNSERVFREDGFDASGVPNSLFFARVVGESAPWFFPESELKAFGWREPDAELDREAQTLLNKLAEARSTFVRAIRKLDREFSGRLHGPQDLKDSPNSLVRERRRQYHQELAPLQTDIEELEARLEGLGCPVPVWLNDPRPYENFWKLTVQQLEEFGWIPPQPRVIYHELGGR